MPARTEFPSQHVLTKPLLYQRGHKMYLNRCWPNPSNANEDSRCTLLCYDQTHPMPARTQHVFQHVLTKPIPLPAKIQNASQNVLPNHRPCQRGHKMYLKPLPWQRGHKMNLNMCCPKPSNARQNTKRTSTCVEQIPPLQARIQNSSQNVLSKPIQCQQGNKMYVNICIDNTPPLPARTKNASQNVLNNPFPCQRGHKMYLNLCWWNHTD